MCIRDHITRCTSLRRSYLNYGSIHSHIFKAQINEAASIPFSTTTNAFAIHSTLSSLHMDLLVIFPSSNPYLCHFHFHRPKNDMRIDYLCIGSVQQTVPYCPSVIDGVESSPGQLYWNCSISKFFSYLKFHMFLILPFNFGATTIFKDVSKLEEIVA